MKKGLTALSLMGYLVAAPLCAAQPAGDGRAQSLDAFFSAQAASDAFNGNVLVADGGKVVYGKSFGLADFETGRRNTADTEFQMASVSKVFTSIAVLELVEGGRIGLDVPYATYFPAFPYKTMTIRQLLSHSSGLSDQDLADALSKAETRLGRPLSMDDLVPVIAAANVPLKLKPGEKWWYCNLGYELLVHLVESRSGQRFDAYLAAHVLRPAGMTHTYLKTATINHADTPQFAQNYDYPHRYDSRRVRFDGARSYYNGGVYGASNVISTTADMLRLDAALSDGRLLKTATLQTAYTPAKLADGSPDFVWKNIGGMGDADDGLGWFVFRDRSMGIIVWHAGGMPGCATLFMRNLTKHQVVVVFDNTDSESLYKKGLSAMRLLNGQPALPIRRSLAKLYGRALIDEGEEAGFAELYAHKNDLDHYSLAEDDLNNLGYEFAAQRHMPEALATFRTAIGLYPASDNLSESYAEILEQSGHGAEAEAMYRRALGLNNGNADAKAGLERLKTAK
jgi:CubicO group peptidase (beta-lactamase class C family)